MSDLQELFARLKASNPDASQNQSPGGPSSIFDQPQQPQHMQASVSSPLFSPPAQTPNPVHSSRIISPVNPSSTMGTPAPDTDKTNNLLNLLKFSNQGGMSGSQAGPLASLQNVGRSASYEHGQQRPLSAHDLMAQLGRPSSGALPSPLSVGGAEKSENAASSGGDSKQFLLNLLRKPTEGKPTSSSSQAGSIKSPGPVAKDEPVEELAKSLSKSSIKPSEPAQTEREPTPIRQFGSPVATTTAFEAPQPTKPTIFNYVNPFDSLQSSSPLNRTPQPESQAQPKKIEILKHHRDASSALNGESSGPAPKSRKVASADPSPARSPAPAEAEKSKTVSEALEDVGEKVDKQVEEALKKADQREAIGATKSTLATIGDNAADAGDVQIKKEPDEDDDLASSWESADDEDTKEDQYTVEVYNFPMKPFVSIQIKDMGSARPLRQDNFIRLAQLKKDFDQIDRGLVTATQTHIVYAQVVTKKETGGFRIIRQDNGKHKQVFRSSGERIFNVQICTDAYQEGHDVEAILGTGVNGSLFWASTAKSRGDLFEDDDVEAHGFIMPPVATVEESTSGSPVKTRAKMSSRHPDFFAVARSKQIHIVAPESIMRYRDKKTRKVDSEKFLAEHGLTINTGKAGKDFAFSEDDTVIVSLDKSGQVKFWDIKELTSRARDTTEAKHAPVELREPMYTLSAAASGSKPDEKPSVSSIMFLDKDRPTSKGVALRYILVGFKQNHILQLWDLGLHKAVQEIRLPHEKDSDGICSITYHPRSGIIAIGHPTRNSIYFIHLSAPRYGLFNMDQARYITMLARNDPTLPRPESTAIMSGLREFSFAKVGQLRSLDMLRQPVAGAGEPDNEEATLFELYAMHSKGVTGVSVKRKDLGWDKDSKMIKPVDAMQAGFINVGPLDAAPKVPPPSEHSSNADTPSKRSKKHETKSTPSTAAKNEPVKKDVTPAATDTAAPVNGSARNESPVKQVPEAPLPSLLPSANPPLMTAESYAMAAQRPKSPVREKDLASTEKSADFSSPSAVEAPRVSSDNDLAALLNKQFDALYQRIDGDKRVSDASGAAKQDAMLRLISSTLTDNVEKSLHRIVSGSIEKEIVPAVTGTMTKAAEKKITEMLPQQLSTIVTREVKAAVPDAVKQALNNTQLQKSITDQVATKVQQQVSQLLQQNMPNLATQATQKMISDLENRNKQQIAEIEKRRVHDQTKIQELSDLVRGMAETISSMSASQAAFQDQYLKLQRSLSRPGTAQDGSAKDAGSTRAETPAKPQDPEVENITQLLTSQQFDAATYAVSYFESARPNRC